MKMTIAALMLTAAVATPAMAQTYVQPNGMTAGPVVQTQPMGYGAYAYVPGWNSSEVTSPVFATDPDPSVRYQLYIQSTVTDR